MSLGYRGILVVACGLVAVSCSSNSSSHPDGGACVTGSEGCACYGNHTCNPPLTCASSLCVQLGGGTGGTLGSGSGGTGGSATGSGGSATGAGGSSTGSGGSSATGGAGGSATGSGGSAGCTCTAGLECTTDGRCVDPKVIDDFADCNTQINLIRGRNGGWYEAADVGINVGFAVSAPPTGFSDRRCAAWETGGPTGNGTTNFALMGVAMTSAGTPVSFVGYTGIQLALEAMPIDFTIKTTNGGYFTKRLTMTSGTQTMSIPFTSLVPRSDSIPQTIDLSQILDIQFTVIDPTMGYGFVIHGLTLY